MKDSLGNWLVVGDKVHYIISGSAGIGVGQVTGVTKSGRIMITPITPILAYSTVTRNAKNVARIDCL